MISIPVRVPGQSYEVLLDDGLLSRAAGAIAERLGAPRIVVVADDKVLEPHASILIKGLQRDGLTVAVTAITASEELKTLATVERLYQFFSDQRLDRSGLVIALGGGLVGDVAGFAAATWMRGVPLVQAPTTLLAMVDASIGGKTAVNIATAPRGDQSGDQSGGPAGRPLLKNMVGAFWQPSAILADPKTLRTLPARELRAGLAECVKHAIIAEPELLAYIEEHHRAIVALESPQLGELLRRSIAIKARIVGEDPTERGQRALLNLGHTFAHAIEPIAELGLNHGEAVAIGLCAAAHLAASRHGFPSADVGRIERVLASIGLPTRLPAADSHLSTAVPRLLEAMGHDKKHHAGSLRLILPKAIGSVEIVEGVSHAAIAAAWRIVGAESRSS